jgi:hypothetical protein
MTRLLLFALLALFSLPRIAWAQIGFPLGSSPGQLCRQAIAAAERGVLLPPRLLGAIARVESGRRDPASGGWQSWPWTVNAEGEGFFYDTKAQAVAAVRDMQGRGIRSIDVGCMQVNLMHHPDAFPSLDAAFDPYTNATWAAHFLADLYAQSGNWPKAVGLYHSATPDLAAEYQRRVQAALADPAQTGSGAMGGALGGALANAWAATIPGTIPGETPGAGGLVRVQALLPPRQQDGLRVLLRPANAPPGRDLAAYRAAPIGGFAPPSRALAGRALPGG